MLKGVIIFALGAATLVFFTWIYGEGIKEGERRKEVKKKKK